MSSAARHVNSARNASDRSRPGVRVRSLPHRGCPPGRAEEGGLERRGAVRRLLAATLTVFAVGCVAAVVGEALARLLVLSTPTTIATRRETAP